MRALRRAPTEFRYWSHLDLRSVRAARALCRALSGFDPAPPDDLVRAFAEMYYDGDPLADAFVAEVTESRPSPAVRDLVDRAIAEGTASIPSELPALARLFEDLDRAPSWLDPERVELGARVFRRYGTSIFHFAGAITLEGYSESSVAKPLALTGAYTGATAKRRFLETASFWIDVSEPGGLARGAPGYTAAVRVRVMHALIRRRLLAHREWRTEEWGVPINQGDAMVTLMVGSFVPGIAMRALGYLPSAREIEAMMHFWRYVGHLMGVRPSWYPESAREAAQLAFVIMVKAAHRAGEDGRLLSHGYVRAFAPDPGAPRTARLRDALEQRVSAGYVRLFVLPSTHRRHQLPSAGVWALWPLAQLPLTLGAEMLRRAVPSADDVLDRLARAQRKRWLERRMDGERAQYRPREALAR
jgi:hypothetical protein